MTKRPSSDSDPAGAPVPAEARWGRVDALLRRLIARLTQAAEGHADALDATLARIRAKVRDAQDEPVLEQLLHDLTEAVRAMDEAPSAVAAASRASPAPAPAAAMPAPAAPTNDLAAVSRVLLAVLERLQLDDAVDERLKHLRLAVNQATSLAILTEQAQTVAGVVNRHCRQLADQRVAAENLLRLMTTQLDELTSYLSQEDADQRDGSGSRQALDQSLIHEIDALGHQVRQASNLNMLQEQVQSRIGTISNHLKSFREREGERERNWQARAEQMSQRIRELEQSAQSMESDLRQEHQLATTDPLTGIPNRLVFEQCMQELCKPDNRPAGSKGDCLLILDIDHFKGINDRFGHAAGDRTLRIVAEQVKGRLRAQDLVARYGGEEFAVVLKDTDADAGMVVANMLRAGIENLSFRGQKQPVSVTLSGGVTAWRAGDTPETLFDRADRALYQAKKLGRNRCELL